VAHEESTMKIGYNTRFLLAVATTERRKRKIIDYFIGHSEATSQDNGSYRSITLNLHEKMSGFGRTNSEKAHEQQVTECRLAEDVHHGV
jgi:hypothetical protein